MAWPFDDPNKFASSMGLSAPQQGDSGENIAAASKIYQTSDGRKASVFDNVLSYKTNSALLQWIELNGNWR